MPLIDLPLSQLETYRPQLTREPDFDAFWSQTLEEGRHAPLHPRIEPVSYPVDGIRVATASYDGWNGARICGWYLLPESGGPHPALVFYHGYGGSKGTVYDYLPWLVQGYAVLAIDVRGQSGESSNPGNYPGGHVKGWMTQGITDPKTYYYRGAFVDAVRAIDFLETQGNDIDMQRLGVTGGSQGGGLTIAVAALDSRPVAAVAFVPFLCHYRRALTITDQMPYGEISQYLRVYPEREAFVYRTLSYCDGMNLASNVRCPIMMTVGLQDLICPPSTVYAAYNHLGAETKSLLVYPYNGHEGNPAHQEQRIGWLRDHVLRT